MRRRRPADWSQGHLRVTRWPQRGKFRSACQGQVDDSIGTPSSRPGHLRCAGCNFHGPAAAVGTNRIRPGGSCQCACGVVRDDQLNGNLQSHFSPMHHADQPRHLQTIPVGWVRRANVPYLLASVPTRPSAKPHSSRRGNVSHDDIHRRSQTSRVSFRSRCADHARHPVPRPEQGRLGLDESRRGISGERATRKDHFDAILTCCRHGLDRHLAGPTGQVINSFCNLTISQNGQTETAAASIPGQPGSDSRAAAARPRCRHASSSDVLTEPNKPT